MRRDHGRDPSVDAQAVFCQGWRKNEPGQALPQNTRACSINWYRALAEQYITEARRRNCWASQ